MSLQVHQFGGFHLDLSCWVVGSFIKIHLVQLWMRPAAWVRNLIPSLNPQQLSPQDSCCMLQQLSATVNMPTSWRHRGKWPQTGVYRCVCVWVCIFLVCVTSRARNSPGSTSQCCLLRWQMKGSDVECVEWESGSHLPATCHQSHVISARSQKLF